MSKKAIFITDMKLGGAQKVAHEILKSLNFDLLVLIHDENMAYQVQIQKDKIIAINPPIATNLFQKIYKWIVMYKRLKRIKKELNINVWLSIDEPANLLNIATKGSEKVILSFHTIYSKHYSFSPEIKVGLYTKIKLIAYKFLIKKNYNKADIMVAVSKAVKHDLVTNFGLDPNKIVVIYNPIDLEDILKKQKEDVGLFEFCRYIITSGRLSKAKGQWYLLRIFRELKKIYPELKLVILGDGELKEYLTNLSRDLGLKTYVWDKYQLSDNFDVYFLGFQKNPFKYVAKSMLFVFPSLYEGFGNALVEAMACGVPVLSADCRSGPREILAPSTDFKYQTKEPEYAEYGILMPTFKFEFKNANEPLDEIEMVWVKVIDDLLKREELRKRYAAKAVERAKHFDINLISNQWSQILDKISTGGM